MSIASIQRFHRLLIGLAEIGQPADLGLPTSSLELATVLPAIERSFQSSVDNPETFPEILAAEESLPIGYRCALLMWLKDESSMAALDVSATVEQHQNRQQSLWKLSFFSPWILFVFIYFGLIGVCWFTVPRLESIYEQLRREPPFAMSVLSVLRQTMLLWGIAFPILAIMIVAFLWRWSPRSGAKGSGFRWLWSAPATRGAIARFLADWNEHDLPQMLAMKFAFDARAGFVHRMGEPSTDQVRSLPPLLRWAWNQQPNPATSPSLRDVALVYSRLDGMKQQRAQGWYPTIVMGIVGGLAVLLFGLSIFGPMVELLWQIARETTHDGR